MAELVSSLPLHSPILMSAGRTNNHGSTNKEVKVADAHENLLNNETAVTMSSQPGDLSNKVVNKTKSGAFLNRNGIKTIDLEFSLLRYTVPGGRNKGKF